MTLLRTSLLSLVAVAMCLIAVPLHTFAADYTVMPLALNLDVAKRDIITEEVTIRNTTDRQLRLYASVNEVALDGEGALQTFVQPSMSDRTVSPTSWFSITRGRIVLAPGETTTIPFTIQMNPQTKPGSYSVYVGFAEASNEPQAQQKILQGDAEGVLVNLRIDQAQNQFLRLARFAVERFMSDATSGEVVYTIENPSQVDVVHSGEVIVYDINGNEVAAVPINQDDTALSPGKRASFEQTLDTSLPMGRYKAFLSIEFGDNLTASINDTAYFYVLPLWQIVIGFFITLFVALLLCVLLYYRYLARDTESAEAQVPMYVSSGRSPDMHHDLNLKPQSTDHEQTS